MGMILLGCVPLDARNAYEIISFLLSNVKQEEIMQASVVSVNGTTLNFPMTY